MSDEKQHAHELIDQLPSHQLSAGVGLLEAILDPISRKLAEAQGDQAAEGRALAEAEFEAAARARAEQEAQLFAQG